MRMFRVKSEKHQPGTKISAHMDYKCFLFTAFYCISEKHICERCNK